MTEQSDQTRDLRTQAYDAAADPEPEREQSPGEKATGEDRRTRIRQRIGLAGGVVAGILLYWVMPDDVGHATRLTAAVAGVMAMWWMTQALPLPVTALVPLALFPVLGRENDDSASDVMQDIGASYGNPIIFLFLGGFMLALAMQRWNLHKRLALLVIRAIGTKPNRMIAGFMIATALVSMWVSNTATAVMMLPIGVSVLLLVAKSTTLTSDAAANRTTKPQGDGDGLIGDTGGAIRTNFGTALMHGIAIVVALLLFILPAGAEKGVRLLDWKTAGHLP
ncbi:di/tricarboxylate transporter [Pseudoclavibacter chungangensis]|nr:di/tricarboxylate transporter [Pseudoclavibacter chungangensis]